MRLLLLGVMGCLLLRAPSAMAAAEEACLLFVRSVLPGLFPYLVLSQMFLSRCPGDMPAWSLRLLGWCGGSPAGARMLTLRPGLPHRTQKELAVACATMSPMFLSGTLGTWLQSRRAGWIALGSVLLGGYLTGKLSIWRCKKETAAPAKAATTAPISFAAAIENAAKTMLLVCGTMTMLRVFLSFFSSVPPPWQLLITTLLEVTTATQEMALLPLPLPLRTALVSGASAFGGMAIVMQNRAYYPQGLLSLPAQIFWQAVHALLTFLFSLGLALLLL